MPKSPLAIIEQRINEKQRPAERVQEYGAKGMFARSELYSKVTVEDIKFNCRFFNEEQTGYSGVSTALDALTLTVNGSSHYYDGTGEAGFLSGLLYAHTSADWVPSAYVDHYLKTHSKYYKIADNNEDTLILYSYDGDDPDDGDFEIVPFIADSMYQAELNPDTSQDTTFKIQSNTDTVITVAPTGTTVLTDVAESGDTWSVKGYYAPQSRDFTARSDGEVQSKIVDAPYGKLVDKNMGAYFLGVYSVKLMCFKSRNIPMVLDFPDSLRIVQTENDRTSVLIDSLFGKNTKTNLNLSFTGNVWKRLDIYMYSVRGDYGFTFDTLNKQLGYYIDAWADITPEAPTSPAATGGTGKMKITWINSGLIGQGGGVQIWRAPTSGGTFAFVNFVAWDGTEYIDTGLNGETTYYYKLRSRNNRGDLSAFTSEFNGTTLPEVGDPGYALSIACISGTHSIDGGNPYYKNGDVLSITVSSPVALTAAPTVTVAGEAATPVANSHNYTNCTYTYTVAGTESEGTQAIAASGTGTEGGTAISGTADIFLDFIAPTVTGTPLIISADDDLQTGDEYTYKADKVWVFVTDDLVDTSGDVSEASGLNKIYLQNAFVGTSTSVGTGELTDSVLAGLFANDYWNGYYLTDSAGKTRQIMDYNGASGLFDMTGNPASGVYYLTKYPLSTLTNWKNYDVSNRQVIIWDLTIDMPYTSSTIPDTSTMDTDHKYRVIAKFSDNSLNISDLCYDDIYVDQTAPGVVTDLTATGDLQSIILSFVTPSATDLDRINIYMNDTSPIAVGGVPTNYDKVFSIPNAKPSKVMEYSIFFSEPEDLTRYFVCTAVDKSGNESVCSSEVSATTLPHWGKVYRNWFDNGSFERLSAANTPTSWTLHGTGSVEADGYYGTNCIALTDAGYYTYDYLYIPSNPDAKFFTFSFYAKYYDVGANVQVTIKLYDKNDTLLKSMLFECAGGGDLYLDNESGASGLTSSYLRYHCHFGSGYNTINSTATYATITIAGDSVNMAYVDGVQWEQTDSGGTAPTAFVDSRVISGDRMMAHFIRGDMIEADTIVASLLRIGVQNYVYNAEIYADAYNNVKWYSGTLTVGGTSYSITAGSATSLTASTTHYLYFDKNVSTTTFQHTTTASTAYGNDKILIAIVTVGTSANYYPAIKTFSASGTIITGSTIKTGKIQSHDGKTYFDLDGDQLVVNSTVDRVILGKTASGKYGIKIYDASSNLLMQVDDDDQIIQSADGKTYVDLKDSEIGMNDGAGNEVIINPTDGLIGKHGGYNTFDVGATTGRAYFKGGVISGRMASIPLYATAFGLDRTETAEDDVTIDDDSWDWDDIIVIFACYAKGYMYVTVTGVESSIFHPIVAKINCITNTFTWINLEDYNSDDSGSIGGICFDGTYIWTVASMDTDADTVEDVVRVFKINPSTFTVVASYDIDAPASLAIPYEICHDGTYLWIADASVGNSDVIYFNTSTHADGVVSLTSNSGHVCYDGTSIWVSVASTKIGKINPSTKACTEYTHGGGGWLLYDGAYLWASNAIAGTPLVTKIDPDSPTTAITTVATTSTPVGMTFDGRYIYVCCHGETKSVDIIDMFTNTKIGNGLNVADPYYIYFDGLNLWETDNTITAHFYKLPH